MRACSDDSSISVSVTARSSSAADSFYLRVLDDPGDRDDLVTAHDEGPGLSLRPRDLGVDEYVLNLLPPAGEAVAGPPSSHFETARARSDPPRPPLDGSVERDRTALEPESLVFAYRLHAAAEVDAARAGRCGEQLGELGRQRLAHVERAQDVLVGRRVQ